MFNGDTDAQRVGDRTADIAADVQLVETAIGKAAACFQGAGRLVRNIVHRTAGRVIAKKCALWAFEDFDTLSVKRGAMRFECEGNRGLVDVDADGLPRRERETVISNSAEGVDRSTSLARGESQARRNFDQIAGFLDP